MTDPSPHHPKCDCVLCVEARKESYARERVAIAIGTGKSEAVEMLRRALTTQPDLQWFYTPEEWRARMVPELQAQGYLGAACSPPAHPETTYFPITAKAMAELRDERQVVLWEKERLRER